MPRVHYTPEQMDQARTEVARLGSLRAAERETGISRTCLTRWTTGKHAPRFQEIQTQLRNQIDERLIDQFNRNAAAAATVTQDALEASHQALTDATAPQPQPDDYNDPDEHAQALRTWAERRADAAKNAQALSNTAKNLATAGGIALDKSFQVQGRPVATIQHKRDAEDILHSLNQLVPGLVLEGTATEIEPKQLPHNSSA